MSIETRTGRSRFAIENGGLLRAERVLHAVEERFFFDVIAAGLRVLFEQLAFAFAELRRDDDVDGDELVALRSAAHARHAAAAHAILRAALRPGRQGEDEFAVE